MTKKERLLRKLRSATTEREVAEAALEYFNSRADGTIIGNSRLVGDIISDDESVLAEIIFVKGSHAAFRLEHDFITNYPSTFSLTAPQLNSEKGVSK